MAGSGRKVFATNDVLLASDLQNYLMDQSVMVFASAAARTAGIASPTKGMLTYLGDSNNVFVYNGSAWAQITAGSSTTAATATTALDSAKVSGQTVFIQAATPTANAVNDLWFY